MAEAYCSKIKKLKCDCNIYIDKILNIYAWYYWLHWYALRIKLFYFFRL